MAVYEGIVTLPWVAMEAFHGPRVLRPANAWESRIVPDGV